MNRDELLIKDIEFATCYALAKTLTLDELIEKVETIKYESFGLGAIMFFKWQTSDPLLLWDAGFRNMKEYDKPIISFQDISLKNCAAWVYTWALYKNMF